MVQLALDRGAGLVTEGTSGTLTGAIRSEFIYLGEFCWFGPASRTRASFSSLHWIDQCRVQPHLRQRQHWLPVKSHTFLPHYKAFIWGGISCTLCIFSYCLMRIQVELGDARMVIAASVFVLN